MDGELVFNLPVVSRIVSLTGNLTGPLMADHLKDMSPEAIQKCMTSVLHILEHLHAQGLCHGNLSFNSVILDTSRDLTPVLIGVDLSQSLQGMWAKLSPGTVGDVRRPVPPEVHVGARADCRSDIYCFGVMLLAAFVCPLLDKPVVDLVVHSADADIPGCPPEMARSLGRIIRDMVFFSPYLLSLSQL